jgi:thioredoxin reductase
VAQLERPFPPGQYPLVVVGSGPAGLQTSYSLKRLGIEHAILSADEEPGGMFRRFPIFDRLISFTKPEAPVQRGTREYELYDHNSLIGEEPAHQALVPEMMDRTWDVPSRPEMQTALEEFVQRAGLRIRYGCRWEGTRAVDDGFVLETTDGEYECRAVVFALGATTPWKASIPGLDEVPHYVETRSAREYQDRRVCIIGKRNSAFEVANSLLPWARRLTLVSPRPVHTASLGHAPVRTRYLQPYDEHVRGGFGTSIVDAAVERVDRDNGGFRVHAHGTNWDGELVIEADEAIAATGFRVPLGDLIELGVATVADGRIPALSPFWESVSVPGLYFAGNASQGAPGLRKHGISSSSSAVNGFRYNARVLVRHLAEKYFGIEPPRPPVAVDELPAFLLSEVARAPELWIQKGYLCRVVNVLDDGPHDDGILPLETFVDETGPNAVAVSVEMAPKGTIYPVVYTRIANRVEEHTLPTHPLHRYEGEEYQRAVSSLVRPLLRSK